MTATPENLTAAQHAATVLDTHGELAMLDYLGNSYCEENHPGAWDQDQDGVCIMYDMPVVHGHGDHYRFEWREGDARHVGNRPTQLPKQERSLWLAAGQPMSMAWVEITLKAARQASKAIREMGEDLEVGDLETIGTPDEISISPTQSARVALLLRKHLTNAVANRDWRGLTQYDSAERTAAIVTDRFPQDEWLELVRTMAHAMVLKAGYGQHANEAAQRVKASTSPGFHT